MNRDGMIYRADGLGNQVISGERLSPLRRSCSDLQISANRQCREPCQYSRSDEQ